MEFLSKEGLQHFWQQILGKLNGYVARDDNYTTAMNKLDNLPENAEANQNAFGVVKTKSGSVNTTLNAAEEVSTLNFEAGANITLSVNAATNTIKIIGADAPEAPEASLESLGISATPTEINHIAGATSNIQNQLNAKVPTTRKVNGKALSSDITLSASDVGAAASSHNHNASDINAGTLDAARLPNISIDKLVAGTANTTIPTSLLPAYVDDVLEYTVKANFPTTGETGKIYVDKTTNLTWRWSGSTYVEISPSLALGSTSSTAHRGDHGAAAYTHSQSAHAPSNAQKNSDITKAEIEAKLTGAITSHTHAYVPTSRTVNGKALSANITLSASDVGAVSEDDIDNYFNITSSGSAIAANTDLNTLTTPGNYSCIAGNVSSLTNCPVTEGGFKLVVINGYTVEYKHQFLYWGAHSYIYYRTRNSNGTWKNWALLNNVSLANADGTLPISKGGTGATTAAEALTTLGAAPAGYGLGTTGTYCANANNANKSGWYGVDANTTNIPSGAAGVMFVKTLSTTNGTDIYQTITSGVTVIQRYYSSWAGAWQSWEYVNPPMTTNIEYRTAERVDGKAVYKKKDSSGQILYRLDGETEWKAQAGLMGAAPTSHTHSDYLNITAAGATIAKNTDLNTITTPGHYSCISGNNSGLSNCPLSSGGFKLIVIQGYSTGYISQFIMAGASHKYFYRSCNSSGTWYAWVDLTDKTPATHTHDYVPTSRTINGKALSSNITLSASDVSAVPTSRTINGKALSSNITLSASDVSARSNTWVPALTDCSGTLSVAKGGTGATDINSARASLKTACSYNIYDKPTGYDNVLYGWALTNYYASPTSANTWGDAYYMLVSSDGTLRVGTQLNDATSITWSKVYSENYKPTPAAIGAAPSSHSHALIQGWEDTRGVKTTPNDYNAMLKVAGIKTPAACEISAENCGSFATLVGIRGWSDDSGGNSHELAFCGNGRLYHRHGPTTSWNAWAKIYTSAEKPTLSELGAAPASHTHSEYYNINSIGTAIAENADLNTYTTPGVYYAMAATAAKLTNSPSTSGFRLVVERGYSTGRYIQRALGGSTSNAEWVRYYSGSAWGTWQRTVRSNSASSAYPTYLQTYSSYAATLGFGCSDSGMWMRAFRDGEYGEYLYLTKDSKNVYTYARGATDTKVSTLYGTANIHYGTSTPTGAYTGQLWFKPV